MPANGTSDMAAAEVKPTVKGLNRTEALASIMQDPVWDVVVVGGGATGAGVALDAASRGLKTLLLEAQDFSAGTSSRSTKLIHGGVRYLKNPRDWGLVHDALVERKRLIDNCPQLVHAEPFVLPCFKKWEREIYMAGLGFYGAMAGKDQIGRTRMLKPEEAEKVLPGVKTEGLLGGVEFFDAQFDDARLNIALIRTAATHGAVCLNYMPVVGLERIGGLIQSVTVEDKHTGESHRIRTKMVFNCAGVWADQIRRLADPQAAQLLRFSRGTHVVVDRSFLPGDAGMLIPKTRDGRVLFAIPWHNAVLLGTTDVEVREAEFDPQPSEDEIAFILETASGYLAKPLYRSDVLAAFAGLRPLLRVPAGQSSTAQASRSHSVISEFGNMITIAGGKWTSYRRMAEDAMLEATLRHLIEPRLCITKDLPILVDETFNPEVIEEAACQGPENDAKVIEYALYARDFEGACTAEDILWRRLRVGVLNAARAQELLPKVAAALEGREYAAPAASVANEAETHAEEAAVQCSGKAADEEAEVSTEPSSKSVKPEVSAEALETPTAAEEVVKSAEADAEVLAEPSSKSETPEVSVKALETPTAAEEVVKSAEADAEVLAEPSSKTETPEISVKALETPTAAEEVVKSADADAEVLAELSSKSEKPKVSVKAQKTPTAAEEVVKSADADAEVLAEPSSNRKSKRFWHR